MESIDVYGSLTQDLEEDFREKANVLGDGRVIIHTHHNGIN